MERIHIGLLSAMPEEVGKTLNHLKNTTSTSYGDLIIHTGEWILDKSSNIEIRISLAWSGWGKVSASRAATRLLNTVENNENLDLIIFTGVAGSGKTSLNQWDIVIANEVIQHDMDARPLFKKYYIPALGIDKIKSPQNLTNWIFKVLEKTKKVGKLSKFGSIKKGLIASGDKFISDKNYLKKLCSDIPDLDAVEMEGAAIAQIATQEKIPWAIVRVISDSANEEASEDFSTFIKQYENHSWEIINCLLNQIHDDKILSTL